MVTSESPGGPRAMSRSRPTRHLTILLVSLCVLLPAHIAPAVAAPPAPSKPAAKGTSAASGDAKQTATIEKLRKTALGSDPVAAEAALAELKSMGEPAQKALLGT